jgi:predicted dehydrogenase
MSAPAPTRVGVIGAGLMARYHLTTMLDRDDTVVAAVCEPAAAAWGIAANEFAKRGLTLAPNEPDWQRFVERYAGSLDAVLISTPHALHHDQAVASLEAGLDALLEKPMVMDAAQATSLIETRDRTGRLLMVAFPGSLSPNIREAARMIRAGEVGSILTIDAVAWQDWDASARGTWRQVPELSGGGFLFDTGAHMLNTVADLVGEEVAEVAAWLENDGAPVDLRGVVMARLASGGLITMNACGRAIPSCASEIRVFCEEAILRTGIWGERLEIQRPGEAGLVPVEAVAKATGTVWEQFLDVRSGRIANPSPPEVGLRMAHLWDAIRASAARGGAVVRPTFALGATA